VTGSTGRSSREDRTNGSDMALLVAIGVVVCPVAFITWVIGRFVLGSAPQVRRWHLAAVALVTALPLLLVPWRGWRASTAADALGVLADTPGGLAPSWALLWALAGLLGRLALRTAPLGVPAGLAVAAVKVDDINFSAEVDPAAQRRRRRAELRRRRQARAIAAQAHVRSANMSPLAISIGGDLPSEWRSGRYVVLPDHAARLPRLAIGRPGAGKTVYLAREAFLAGLETRQLIALDGKGEASFADAIVAAYTAGWTLANGGQGSPTVHLFPDEPLNAWLGGPQAQVNRLMGLWPWSVEADWYKQQTLLALRLVTSAPGRPVTSMAQLVTQLDPATLGRAWQSDRTEAQLVSDLKDHLGAVRVRCANVAAAAQGLLDGERPIGAADCTVVSIPVMAQQEDSERLFRLVMGDLAHWASVRKTTRPALVMVDEFSSITGAREQAIHLLERGRSAAVPVLLAGQSYTSLGDEQERDRLISAAGTVVLFASSTPDELVRLAGSVQTAESVLTYESGGWTGRASVSSRQRHKVDPNTVRQLAPGEAVIISGGHAEHVQVVMAPSDQPAAIDPPRRGRLALPPRRRP
jgi:hypothetical protein